MHIHSTVSRIASIDTASVFMCLIMLLLLLLLLLYRNCAASHDMAVVMCMSAESQLLLAVPQQLQSQIDYRCYYASNCSSRGTMSVSAAVYVVLKQGLTSADR
jgi:hypothetical protein